MHRHLSFLLFTLILGISAVASTCTPPREGLWIVYGYEGFPKFKEPVNGYMKLTRDPTFPSVYTGDSIFPHPSVSLFAPPTGRSIFFATVLGPRMPVLFLLRAVFDEKECLLHGTNIAPVWSSRDVISWTVNGEEDIHGKFVAKLFDYYIFPFTCMQKMMFTGEKPDEDVLSLLNDAGHSSLGTNASAFLSAR